MKQLVKIWVLVFAMVMGGALPPQVTGENTVTSQWCAQAKSKKKSKKNKKKDKKKSRRSVETQNFASRSSKSSKSSVSTLASVPTIGKTSASTTTASASHNALMAVGTPKGMSNQVLNYKTIRVNYNPTYKIPNCVAYELTATMVDMADAPGHENRKSYNYAKDNSVKSCPENWEYRGSGYSRGHMAPAMDMRWDKTAMAQCFYMTNMCPQDTKLNNDHWRVLEEKVHRWAKRDKRLMVYTGFFKVIYAPEQGRAIAFIYDNKPCPGNISKYAVTVAEVERRTGLTFSSAIPKRQCNIDDWQ